MVSPYIAYAISRMALYNCQQVTQSLDLNRSSGMVEKSIRHVTARRQSTVSNGHDWKRLWVAQAIAGGELFNCRQTAN